jgi:hypothetical protein
MIRKSLCTWWLQYRKLQVMFNVSLVSLQTFIDTRLTLAPLAISNSKYVMMVSDWNCLNHFCVFLCCNHQVHRDILITLYYWSYTCRNLTFRAQQWLHNQFYNTIFRYKAAYSHLLTRASQVTMLAEVSSDQAAPPSYEEASNPNGTLFYTLCNYCTSLDPYHCSEFFKSTCLNDCIGLLCITQ